MLGRRETIHGQKGVLTMETMRFGLDGLHRQPVPLTPDLVEIYRHDWAYDASRAGRELGYAPRSLAAGLGETFDWLRTTPEWPRR